MTHDGDRPGSPSRDTEAPGRDAPGRERRPGTEVAVEGVTALDHTADVGLEIEAPDLETLLVRAARGMDWLLHEAPPPSRGSRDTSGPEAEEGPVGETGPSPGEPLSVDADDPPTLLRAVLRELLFRLETRGLALVELQVDEVSRSHLRGRAVLAPCSADPVREIKGVTLHGLEAGERDGGWWGRVIFDV